MSTMNNPNNRNSTNSLTGTATLVRLALRRDRVVLPVWVLSIGALVLVTGAEIGGLYDTAAQRAALAASTAGDASLRALYGQLYDTGSGGLTAWRIGAFGTALAGLMGAFTVVRHTREEEEEGRLELIGAGAVGRRAPLAAALVTGGAAGLALATVVTLGLLGQGAVGALALGLGFGAVAALFAGVAAVAAQLTGSARAARGISGAVLGIAFLLRAAGDGAGPDGPGWLGAVTPLGWAERVRPFAGERWWWLAALAAAAAALTACAYGLVARRDLDAGLLPPRPGPVSAGPRLRGVFGLAWRLQRGALYGWLCGYAVCGAAFGGLAKGAVDTVRGNRRLADSFRHLGGAHSLVDSYLSATTTTLGMVAAAYAVQAVLRLRAEEGGGRAEPVLAAAVGRVRWAASHLTMAAVGTVALMAAGGLGMGLGYGATVGDPLGRIPRLLAAALVQLPAVWVIAAIAVLLHGAAPKYAPASWSALSLSVALGLYGPLLGFGQWALDLSAFTHVPKLPAAHLTVAPLLWLTAGSAALAAGGLAALRRRDMG